MATFTITDPVTGGPHNAPLKPVKAAPITSPDAAQETYDQLRERFLLRWCREKSSQGWCGTFDNIMVHDLGYTAKEVLEARARFDYRHAATVTFTSIHEINKAGEKSLLDYVRRYIREYFSIENTAGCTGTLEMVGEPQPEPTGLTELQIEKRRVLTDNRVVSASSELAILMSLGYTTAEVAAMRSAGRWTYKITLNWHSPNRIGYPSDLKANINDRVMASDRAFHVTDSTITAGTTIELN